MPQTGQLLPADTPGPVDASSPGGPSHRMASRIWFTLVILVVYRLGTQLPIPGINSAVFAESFRAQSSNVLVMFDMLVGGAIGRMAIFALGIIPYIWASIFVRLAVSAIFAVGGVGIEGEEKCRRAYTPYVTFVLAALQAFAIALSLEGLPSLSGPVVMEPGWVFRASTVITLTCGAMLMAWLAEKLTARGVGNGPCLLVFSGIVAGLPGALARLIELTRQGAVSMSNVNRLTAIMVVVLVIAVFFEGIEWQLLVASQERGKPKAQKATDNQRVKLNSTGIMPPVFASSLLVPLIAFAQLSGGSRPDHLDEFISALSSQGRPLYFVSFAAMIAIFAFYFRAPALDSEAAGENLRTEGGPLADTLLFGDAARQFDHVHRRIALIGAVYLSLLCVIPEMLAYFIVPDYFLNGPAVMIVIVGMRELLVVVMSSLFNVTARQ